VRSWWRGDNICLEGAAGFHWKRREIRP